MDCGACLGCGLGFNVAIKTDKNQIFPLTTWYSDKPNPLPIFKRPNEFWTPILLPGLYLPVELIADYHVEDGLLYHPLSDADEVDRLVAFATHESVHQALLLGIIPMTLRLTAANFYTSLTILLNTEFNAHSWDILNRLNLAIEVVHNATAAMHEVAAIVENQSIIPFDNPYIQDLSEKSAQHYAMDENYGSDFIRYYNSFQLLIMKLKQQFAPTPLQGNTIIALADYIISSAIDLQELTSEVLKVPLPITDAALPEFLRTMGIPYLTGGKKRTLNDCHDIQVGFGAFTVYGTGRRLERTLETILSANFKRKRKMPKDTMEQLLYIAEAGPRAEIMATILRRSRLA